MNTNSVADSRGKVLVIDDEPAILFTLKRILEHAGYGVGVAQSGKEGLSAFRQGHWDLVTLDRSMPTMNGEEVATELRQIAPHVPLVLITGFTTAVVRPELFDAVLGKPFRAAELLDLIANVLTKHRSGANEPHVAAGCWH